MRTSRRSPVGTVIGSHSDFGRGDWRLAVSRSGRSSRAKRLVDVVASGVGLLVLSPVMIATGSMILLEDRGTPFYRARRCGLGDSQFTMLKFRTMVLSADKIGGSSTGSKDPRITSVGRALRATKLDELPQLINVLRGEMSLVGPRPNIDWEVATYSAEEAVITTVRPGITDLASIVFADEGEILAEESDPDLAYEQLIRPWKSRLGIIYARNVHVGLDLKIIALTLLNSIDREAALKLVGDLVAGLGGDDELVSIARRQRALEPTPPPGYSAVIDRVPA